MGIIEALHSVVPEGPEFVVIEDVYVGVNARSSLGLAKLFGALVGAFTVMGVRVECVSSAQVRAFLGLPIGVSRNTKKLAALTRAANEMERLGMPVARTMFAAAEAYRAGDERKADALLFNEHLSLDAADAIVIGLTYIARQRRENGQAVV